MKYNYKKDSTFKILIGHYRPYIGLFILDLLCAVLVSAVDLIFPYISRNAMTTYLPQGLYKTFFIVMGIMIGAYIIRTILFYIISYWGHRLGVFIETDLRSEIFSHLETLSFNFYDKNRTGQLMSRVTTDLFEITELAHHCPEDLIISIITLVGAFVILCTIEWRLALIVFAVIPLFIIFILLTRKKMRDSNMKVKVTTGIINSSIESGFSGIRTAKAFAAEDQEIKKFEESNVIYKDAKKGFYTSMAIFNGGMEFFLSILSVIVITAGGYFILKDELNYLDLITFTLYISTFINPMRKLVALIEQYMAGMAGLKRFLEIMRTDPDIQDAPDAIELQNVKGDIRFDHVSFYYDEEKQVLSNININIPAGTSFALVGPSGGGKSTMCHLIPRFYEVKDGCVSVDDHDVRTVTQKSLRKSIGIVQQDVFLFAGTIYDNIAYGTPEATYEQVIEAAKRAEIHTEILEMPNGYDTYVGERGIMLSGGQKQRIGIARVFLKNPPIIILDEATSALDSVTESRIQSAFDELAKGRTSVIIAHRLSTVKNADLIAVIDHEKIAELGTHEELLALNGEYAHLCQAQRLVIS